MQAYYDRMHKLFKRGKLEDVEQNRSFLFWLCPKIKRNCAMWDYVNMDVVFVTILEVEWVLVKLGDTLFEPLKEEQEDGIVVNVVVEKKSMFLMSRL